MSAGPARRDTAGPGAVACVAIAPPVPAGHNLPQAGGAVPGRRPAAAPRVRGGSDPQEGMRWDEQHGHGRPGAPAGPWSSPWPCWGRALRAPPALRRRGPAPPAWGTPTTRPTATAATTSATTG